MMRQQQAIALIERYYTAFNGGDARGMLTCLSDDVAHDVNRGDRETAKARSLLPRAGEAGT